MQNIYPSYEKAKKMALSVEWKVIPCFSGESCWCRMIEPKEPIYYDEGEPIIIVSSAAITKEIAEHIVLIHNTFLSNG